MLGEQPQRGQRLRSRATIVPAAAGVALISDSLWRRRYQAELSAIGRVIRLDDVPYTIVGVMPPEFRFPSTSELWIPITPALGPAAGVEERVDRRAAGAGRHARSRQRRTRRRRVLPRAASRTARASFARPYASTVVGGEERLITGALMGATTVLLLIACVNVANLLLARGAGRRREIALRAALGASRGRIIRQLLTESVLLVARLPARSRCRWRGTASAGCTTPCRRPSRSVRTTWTGRWTCGRFSYALAIALVTGVAFGMAPAFERRGPAPAESAARRRRRGEQIAAQRRVHSVLIVAQIALALVLLAGASLFVRTYAG